jgi:hypothetical protein
MDEGDRLILEALKRIEHLLERLIGLLEQDVPKYAAPIGISFQAQGVPLSPLM